MIVSHEHKVIFLKGRKVAGTSFEIALSKYLGDADIITPISRNDEAIRTNLGFVGPRNFNFDLVNHFAKDKNAPVEFLGIELPLKFYNHMPAKLARKRLGDAIWRDYKKISLVRNPWDRAVSIFFWKNTKKSVRPNLDNFTKYFKENKYLLEINYANYMINKKDIIDFYIRYENFEEDILDMESKISSLSGLWQTFKGINAKGATRDRSHSNAEIYEKNPAVNSLIEKLNAWEIDKFGYHL